MQKIGFIFDLDGVIVDTAKYHYKAWKNLANQLGFEFTKEQNELFKGVSRKRSLEILLELGNVKATQEQFNLWMADKNKDYLAYIEKMDVSEILPDVLKVLDFLIFSPEKYLIRVRLKFLICCNSSPCFPLQRGTT